MCCHDVSDKVNHINWLCVLEGREEIECFCFGSNSNSLFSLLIALLRPDECYNFGFSADIVTSFLVQSLLVVYMIICICFWGGSFHLVSKA